MSWTFFGLTDRVLGRAWNREPRFWLTTYMEKAPDTLHLHGSWLAAEPVYALWRFTTNTGNGPKFLARLSLVALSAVRADLVDPAVPPVLRWWRIGVVEVKGISAILDKAETVFFVHALQVQAGPPPRWPGRTRTASAGRSYGMRDSMWKAGRRIGSSGVARMQDEVFPLRLEGVLELESLPLFTPSGRR